MIVNAMRRVSRLVLTVVSTVILVLLVCAVAGASVLGIFLVVQGWASSPQETTIHAPTASR